MIKIFVFCFNFLFLQRDTSSVTHKEYLSVINGYKQLLVDIREYKLSPQQARERFQEMMFIMKKAHPAARYDSTNVQICFPLMGFDFRAVGGRGSGYIPRGYDLFDQAKKGSHPAHDIFMKDKDQDSRDDRTGDYVPVLSTTNGVVIATENGWQAGSEYRGGNYIWIYDTTNGGLWYYAHQREIYVKTGQTVRAGQKIALVGRTGFNAAMPRSDTHLHMTYLRIDDEGNPFPVNTYGWLKQATTLLDPRIAVDLEPISAIEVDKLPVNIKKMPIIEAPKVAFRTVIPLQDDEPERSRRRRKRQ
ncbi:MAG: M23 family metallopeptidase [Emticicia sp.]|uniref:M23 family metallopeptidase n=1 Tax=Emticicia sp. TaxID=1930953 RepID=UPI003BA61CC2